MIEDKILNPSTDLHDNYFKIVFVFGIDVLLSDFVEFLRFHPAPLNNPFQTYSTTNISNGTSFHRDAVKRPGES